MADRQQFVKLCECGCGLPAPLASETSRRRGYVKGQPVRFIHGHHARKHPVQPEPNPGGLCLCGCGRPTPLARHSVHDRGWVKGKPVPYLQGHGARKRPDTDGDYTINEAGCWIWQKRLERGGYGHCDRAGEQQAHRWYYRTFVGPIPEGRDLHHTCETPACVNPAHLEPLTKVEHRRRHREARSAAA